MVIGILIALQINTWNNERQESVKEVKVLTELKAGFELDLEVLENELLEIKKAIADIQELKKMVGNPNILYEEGLDSLFGAVYGTRNVRLTQAFYEDLKSSGFDLIKSDDIRLRVVKLFEDNYAFIRRILLMENSINSIVRPYYLQHFHDISFCEYATPHNYRAVWNDSYYKNIIHYHHIALEGNQKAIYERKIPLLKELIAEITNYTESTVNE